MKLLTSVRKCGIIATAETRYDCCGDADAAAEAPPRLYFSPNLARIVWSGGRILSLVRRKEAISWRTHSPGVASVVKVIWFRFRISVARELPSSTRPGFAPTHRAFTTSKSVTAISLLMNPSAMGRSTPTAAVGSRYHDRIVILSIRNDYPVNFLSRFRGNGWKKGKRRSHLCLLPFLL